MAREDDDWAPQCMREETVEDVIFEPACIDDKTFAAEVNYIYLIHRDMVENNKRIYTSKYDLYNGDRLKITVEKEDE